MSEDVYSYGYEDGEGWGAVPNSSLIGQGLAPMTM